MPSKSRSQQRLMQAAEHGATFPKAEALRASMTHQQLHDFASGSEAGKPQRVASSGGKAVGRALHPHKNLGAYLHPRKR